MRPRILWASVLAAAIAPLTAAACGWDWETFAAEATRLPCVNDAILGAFGTHAPEYYETTIAATDMALAWAPFYTEALDAKGMALTHLGRLREAEPVLRARLRAAPDAYPSHANLGTLYTFTGDYDKALEHIDRALTLEPQAHFGREKYHRQLVEFLKRKPGSAESPANFLGVELSDAQRFAGSREKFTAAGLTPDVFDALVAMIAVYGAEALPELYFTLGDALALRGETKLAWAAYRRAVELGHPASATIGRYAARLLDVVLQRSSSRRHKPPPHEADKGGYRGLPTFYAAKRAEAKSSRADHHRWERARLRAGLRPWVRADIAKVYAHMDSIRQRCKTPHVLEHERSPLSAASEAGATRP